MRYAGPRSPGGVANSFEVMQWAFVALSAGPGSATALGRCVHRLPGLGAAVVATPSIKAWRAGPTPLDRTDREETQLETRSFSGAQRVLAAPADKVYDVAD